MKQPFLDKEGLYICPECFEEMYGDGENHIECSNCEYVIHEIDLKDDLTTLSDEEIEERRK